jgi:tetratricopeptide (TPR) repeat protein
LNNIATLLQNSGKIPESEPYWKKLLVVAEKAYGKDSLQYAQVLNGLGILALNARQYALAEANLGACIQIREKILGTGHLLTGDTAYNLAIALANQGKTEQALGLIRHAFAVAQIGLGINSPVTAQRLEKLKSLEKGTLTEQIQPVQQAPKTTPQPTTTTKSKKKTRH